ncbi:DUF3793 family protein [Clostridium sp. UBA6640]|uniref:DUF3793 family protein n=1 Tax=Clostridium sp. UBA6640 TaxID=1946370 RepID=UPI0025C3B183|nr:DUF3793 family protein [Clostridium sp. UBA6640]
MKLAVKAFREKINTLNDVEYMFNVIAYNIAPTIKGLKAATTVTLCNHDKNMCNNWKGYKHELLNRLKIKAFELKETNNAVVVLFYNEELLNNRLEDKRVTNFLVQFGYEPNMSITEKLEVLKKRYDISICPHEMGIFLGFPLNDVQTFIESPHKECLLCGYWKVYYDRDSALQTFKYFDEAKLEIVNSICQGKKLFEAIEVLSIAS